MFRDDRDALLARLDALDARQAAHEAELATRDAAIAERDARIAELEGELTSLRRELLDRQATKVDAERRRPVVSRPIESKRVTPGSSEAREESARLLAEGIERYNAGDRQGATACFQRGLSLTPGEPQLVRALRRYT